MPDDPIELETDSTPTSSASSAKSDPLGHLPPDEGPEQHVKTVRPSFWKGRPLSALLLLLLPIAAMVLVMVYVSVSWKWWLVLWAGVVLGGICWGTLLWWFVTLTLGQSLRVTNKRIVETRGLFSKATDEVLLDHIRNIRVHQSFIDRILNVGHIGISSSGQDDIEVQMADIPNPKHLRDVLDRYRSLDA